MILIIVNNTHYQLHEEYLINDQSHSLILHSSSDSVSPARSLARLQTTTQNVNGGRKMALRPRAAIL